MKPISLQPLQGSGVVPVAHIPSLMGNSAVDRRCSTSASRLTHLAWPPAPMQAAGTGQGRWDRTRWGVVRGTGQMDVGQPMASRVETDLWPWTHRFAGLRLDLPPPSGALPQAQTRNIPPSGPPRPPTTLFGPCAASNRRTEPPNRFTIGYSSRNTSKRP